MIICLCVKYYNICGSLAVAPGSPSHTATGMWQVDIIFRKQSIRGPSLEFPSRSRDTVPHAHAGTQHIHVGSRADDKWRTNGIVSKVRAHVARADHAQRRAQVEVHNSLAVHKGGGRRHRRCRQGSAPRPVHTPQRPRLNACPWCGRGWFGGGWTAI